MSRSSTLHIKPTFRKFFTSYTCLQTTFIHLGYSAHRSYYICRQITLNRFCNILRQARNFTLIPKNLQSPATTPFSLRTQKSRNLFKIAVKKEAWVGIEPTVKLLQSHALPLGYHALKRSFIRKKRKTYCKLFFACAALLLKLSQIKKFLLRRLNPARPACANENRSTPARGKLQSGPALRRP